MKQSCIGHYTGGEERHAFHTKTKEIKLLVSPNFMLRFKLHSTLSVTDHSDMENYK